MAPTTEGHIPPATPKSALMATLKVRRHWQHDSDNQEATSADGRHWTTPW
jgi:hypothetical protein